MGITIEAVQPDNAPALMRIGHAAFEDDPFQQMLLHGLKGATPQQVSEYEAWRIGRMRARLSKAGGHWNKAVDTETGEIVGMTGMFEPEGSKAENANPVQTTAVSETASDVPEVVDKKFMDDFLANLSATRKRLMGDRNDFWYIISMAVHPRHQRRGIGQALLKANTDLADAAKGDIYLEARTPALKLYESAGFEEIGVISGLPKDHAHIIMLRKPRPSA